MNTLFDTIKSETIDQRFARFDAAHPEVYEMYRRFALELLSRGRTHYSSDAILHRVRWETDVNPNRDFDGLKLNDHFSSRYARKLAREDARFKAFFSFRELRERGAA